MTDASPAPSAPGDADASDSASPRSPRPRRPRPGTAERREEILRAAMRVFGSRGYHQGSLAEVAEQVGITHAGVLHHFGSKERLLTEVLASRDRDGVAHLEGQHMPGGLDLFRHLVATAAANAERPGIVQTYTVLAGEAVTDDHPARAWVTARFAGLRADVAGALREVVEERRAAGDETAAVPDDRALDLAASTIIAAMDGLQTQWLLDPDAVDLAEATAFAIEAVLAATLAGARRPRPLA
ncbi:MAG: TetR/AcrR family transcriptional regulator [Cellulosimicrobium funkei]|uniref:TetR family transcriptional regulator n=1 Tax=Cellulosimicrobium cellulans TaxID=1710 RepID=A0AAV5P156_CELCE|nr:TetR/AcrR family transcriptional regulator [Cellulosimicrobium cellulans]QDP74756.1 TetR/AcrR family transcriptional regulator [Cellulosimicrobium cellulans]UTT59930.1 TetR/AcrR family transcriptional regulator [Cellulosimicrobium cellulans]GLY56019.1 TetR family transcriptional regulator [Cellulosimicrobium cellulans]